MSVANQYELKVNDPQTHNDDRSKFVLESCVRKNNWMVHAGVYDTNLTGAEGAYYPTLLGVYACVKHIELFSGATSIDRLDDVPQKMTQRLREISNAEADDLQRQQLLSGMGFDTVYNGDIDKAGALTLSSEFRGFYNTLGAGSNAQTKNNQVQIANASDGVRGILDLRKLLLFLQTPIIPNLPDLTLVITWNTNAADYYLDPNEAGGLTTLNLKVMRPRLLTEDMIGNMPPQNVRIPYVSVISDRFTADATNAITNAAVPKRTSYLAKGFENRFVRSLSFFKQPASDLQAEDRWLTRKTRSCAQKAEQIQVRINNENVLPVPGADSATKQLSYYASTYRPVNIPLCTALPSLRDASGNVIDPKTQALVGQCSYFGVKINKPVNRCQIEHQRLHGPTASSQEALTVYMHAEVERELDYKVGSPVRIVG